MLRDPDYRAILLLCFKESILPAIEKVFGRYLSLDGQLCVVEFFLSVNHFNLTNPIY